MSGMGSKEPYFHDSEPLWLKMKGPLREVARTHGYALAVHGTLKRDIDLVACPWSEPCRDAIDLALAIRSKAAEIHGHAFIAPHEEDEFHRCGCPGMKPHGRLVWSFHLGGGPYIDLSVFPPTPDPYATFETVVQFVDENAERFPPGLFLP